MQPVDVVRVLAGFALQWRDVVAFEPPGLAAHDAAPPVAFEDGAAHGGPAPGVKVAVVMVHFRRSG